VERLRSGGADAVLVAGAAASLGSLPLKSVPGVVIGPGASAVAGARVAIDTGVAGIHEAGTGYRLDDVPLPLRPVLAHTRAADETLELLRQALRRRAAGAGR
jgi:formylmethanofuran dehydrogenase subunit B